MHHNALKCKYEFELNRHLDLPHKQEAVPEADGLPVRAVLQEGRHADDDFEDATRSVGQQSRRREPSMLSVTSQDGTTIAYDQVGSGPALVIVGGSLADHHFYAPLAEELARHLTVYRRSRPRLTIQRRGGRSTPRRRGASNSSTLPETTAAASSTSSPVTACPRKPSRRCSTPKQGH